MKDWELTDQELEELRIRGGNADEAQRAKRQAFRDNGGVILNPAALEDMYQALKDAVADIDKTGYTSVSSATRMQRALAKALKP